MITFFILNSFLASPSFKCLLRLCRSLISRENSGSAENPQKLVKIVFFFENFPNSCDLRKYNKEVIHFRKCISNSGTYWTSIPNQLLKRYSRPKILDTTYRPGKPHRATKNNMVRFSHFEATQFNIFGLMFFDLRVYRLFSVNLYCILSYLVYET